MGPRWGRFSLTIRCPCRKPRPGRSGGLSIFVDDAADAVVSSGAEGLEIGDFGWQRLLRCGAGEGHVRPVAVVVGLVFTLDSAQVREVPDQGAVEQFTAGTAD